MYDSGEGVEEDDAQAAYWYHKAAEQGDPDAQFNLGLMYKYGRGVEQDKAQAVHLFRKAAERGELAAQSKLGEMYGGGEGTPQDNRLALRWIREAAERGHSDAMFKLGSSYLTGIFAPLVPKNYILAYMWYSLATEGPRNLFAGMWRYGRGKIPKIPSLTTAEWDVVLTIFPDSIASLLTPAEIVVAQRLAREWTPRPAEWIVRNREHFIISE